MSSSQSPSFTAEFIKEEPGKPVPQKPVRRRGLNDQIKWVKAWMSKLPQGDEDWDNNRPSTLEDILRLRDRLKQRHSTDSDPSLCLFFFSNSYSL